MANLRSFVSFFFPFLLLLSWGSHSFSLLANNQDDRPNIIVIFTDDQSFHSLGVTGNSQIKSPNFDRLAADGVLFEKHYNSTAICMASRASLMTGLYEYKTGCNFGHGPMREATFQKSYPVLLRKAGYRTGFAGKFGFAVSDDPTASEHTYDHLPLKEFDSWAGGVGQTNYKTARNLYLKQYADRYPHSTRAYGAYAQDFIKESASDKQPFCLTLFFKAPHRPFTPDPYFDEIYKGVTFEKAENYGRENAQHLAKQSRLGRQYLSFFESFGYSEEKSYQETLRRYHQLIYGVDYALGMIREELKTQGLEENTIILCTSDNGYFSGSHGFGGKVLPYEEGSKVPLIIYDPRQKSTSPQRSSAITGTVDIAPTVLSYAGLDIPQVMDGKSLIPVVNQTAAKVRKHLPLFQVWGAAPTFSMSIVTPRYKYIYWCFGDRMEPAEEVFHLEKDPLEMNNCLEELNQETLASLRKLYRKELNHWKKKAVP
ncbi:Mucin-desulfating sulfatase [Planctomycetales bacterium 10988]|nr:Mucin-desulfating sulfatase [Planctomycetales bacterium 10988]